ncbi:MAG: thioredoxin fold domain-containing protein [Planctomycetota bacterium]|nr:thioredoxin fold domain-containing protein [Planctomycetota bacterium]
MDADTYPDPKVQKLAKSFVMIKVNCTNDNKEFAKQYKVRGYPSVLVIKNDETVLKKIGGYVPAPQFAKSMEKALEEYGPVVSPAALIAAEKALKAAQAAVEKKDYPSAIQAANKVVASESAGDFRPQAQAIIDRIDNEGLQALKKARELLGAGQEVEGYAALAKALKTFRGTPASEQIAAAVKEVEEDAAIMGRIETVRKESEANELWRKADRAHAKKKYTDSVRLMEILVKEHAGTTGAESAKKRLASYQADPAIQGALREEVAAKECKRLLMYGKNFASNGKKDKAREFFQKVIQKWPGTKFAAEAEKLLNGLR